ncbi:(deoxy)nucleoside triphosphate pyrophosphohydrolase [Brevifollis gellanilyticus]|uniref:8-oxo-dGTP diphosphatase n=1 Tax=Brevifollis gellanilyticus TaxID=748831 RepID=A0A512MF10_9BACT|nr:(deoxy)nucleoside triphosphate pyrophosphohydrolase [Brevifollis gellanilyticus]GEP44941.1 NUDIX hydrolase [Brevifollis gellanilyticus]
MSTFATPVVCAIIEQDGLIMVAQRPPGKRLEGCWEFPGGKIEMDELPEEALHRELFEELGCQVEIIQTGRPVSHVYDWGSIMLHPFRCSLVEGSQQPVAYEHSALQWLPLAELGGLELAPADLPVLEWLNQEAAKAE